MSASVQASAADGLRYEISMMESEVIANRTRDPALSAFCTEELKKLRAKLRRITRKFRV